MLVAMLHIYIASLRHQTSSCDLASLIIEERYTRIETVDTACLNIFDHVSYQLTGSHRPQKQPGR